MKSAIAVSLVLLVSALVAGSAGPAQGTFQKSHRLRAEAMAEAARAWLEALPDDVRPRASAPWDDGGRLSWGYADRERQGVTLGEQGSEGRRLLDRLLQACLSQQGYLKVHGVLALEETLDRDAYLYYALIYGEPSATGPWAWRLEGHHLSLNVTVTEKGAVTATPLFLGAEPAVVPDGPRAGFELFFEEEALARELFVSLDEANRKRASPDRAPPGDVVLDPTRTADLEEVEGLSAGRMTPQQTFLLMRLLGRHVAVLHEDLHLAAMHRYRLIDLRDIYFLWLGDPAPGAPMYYRIHSRKKGFAVEYVNRGGHVHASWRDFPEDFGGALAEAPGDGSGD